MVYRFASTPPENCYFTTEDRNVGKRLANHDEVACITYPGCYLGGTTDPLSVIEFTPRIMEFEERHGD